MKQVPETIYEEIKAGCLEEDATAMTNWRSVGNI
jgi:hypothetical protein